MGKRSAKFLGSPMWRSRDVSVEHLENNRIRVTDQVSKISIISTVESEDTLLRRLSHRVHQFE